MSTVFTVCGIGICAVFAISIIKEVHPEYNKWIVLSFVILCLSVIIPTVATAISFIKESAALSNGSYISLLLRALGITYLISIACEICNSVGETSIGRYIELIGKVEILILAIPLFRDLLDIALI